MAEVVFLLILLFLLASLLLPVGLYLLVRAEHGERETMDRDDAERVAQRDTDDER